MRRKAEGLKWKVMAMRASADSRDPEMSAESKNGPFVGVNPLV